MSRGRRRKSDGEPVDVYFHPARAGRPVTRGELSQILVMYRRKERSRLWHVRAWAVLKWLFGAGEAQKARMEAIERGRQEAT